MGIDRDHDFTVKGTDPASLVLKRLGLESEGVVLENLENLDQLPVTGINLQIGLLYRSDIREESIISVKAFIPEA